MAQYEELAIDQGTDVAIELRLSKSDGTRKNLAGYSVAAQIRQTVNTVDSDAITFNSIIPDPASAGIITLSLSNIESMRLTAPRYLYDVELSFVDSSDNTIIERILEGVIIVNPNITRV